jgi:DNA-binding PadR family transcriptional regulator
MMRIKKPEDFLPLNRSTFLIMLSLVDQPRHGYGIMLEMSQQTDGAVRVAPGTLYTTIKKLMDAGLIEEAKTRPKVEEDDERRRYYSLTDLGREVVRLEAERLLKLVAIAKEKQLLGDWTLGKEEGPCLG